MFNPFSHDAVSPAVDAVCRVAMDHPVAATCAGVAGAAFAGVGAVVTLAPVVERANGIFCAARTAARRKIHAWASEPAAPAAAEPAAPSFIGKAA